MLTLFFVFASFFCDAQNKEQEGKVKTRGRLGDDGKVIPGMAISDASIILKGGNSTVSEKNGDFSILLPSETYFLQNVQKQGYVIVDQDILSKQYLYSKNPLLIVMETPSQQAKDELAAERKIRRTLTRQLHEREDEIERLKAENRISAEEYREALQQLYSNQENNEQLISEMAERYTKIDYDYIDEFYIQVSSFILNGELTKADSMLNAKGNIGDDIKKLNQLKEINAKERAELGKRQKRLEKSEAMAQYQLEDIAQRCYNKYEIFKMQHQNDSAMYYLELRASLDTTNVQWMMDVGVFAYKYIADYDMSMDYYEKVKDILMVDSTTNSRMLADVYNNIGVVYDDMGYLDTAMCYYKNALQLCGDDVDMIYYMNIGVSYAQNGEYEKATEYYNRVLSYNVTNTNIDEVIFTYINMAEMYGTMSDYDNALLYYEKALSLNSESLNDASVEASCCRGMGTYYFFKGDIESALENLKISEKLFLELYGEKHPRFMHVLNNTGYIYQYMGRYKEAQSIFLKVLDVSKEIYGGVHPDLAVGYNRLGSLYMELGDYEKSKECFLYALSINELYNRYEGIAICYKNLGDLYRECGDYDNALDYMNKSLDIMIRLFGENNDQVATIYNSIGLVYVELQNYETALEYHLKSFSNSIKIYGEDNYLMAADYNNIGYIYNSLGNCSLALEYLNKSLSLLKEVVSENNLNLAMVYKNIAKVYFNTGELIKSLEYNNIVLNIYKTHYDDNHEKVVEINEKINEINSKLNKN